MLKVMVSYRLAMWVASSRVVGISYFYFHSSLGLEVEDVAMEGLSRGEVWDGQCKDPEGCCVFCD